MADRPILFSAPMVRALLAGTKTQTRRLLKPQPYPLDGHPGYWNASGVVGGRICVSDLGLLDLHRKPKPGDRLYVREAWRVSKRHDGIAPRDLEPRSMTVFFGAGGSIANQDSEHDWRPVDWPGIPENVPSWVGRPRVGMHMPRWASRLTLYVTGVRIERLQDISETDALAEGMMQATAEAIMEPAELAVYASTHILAPGSRGRILYEHIWNHINGAGSWDDNPWVAAYTFAVAVGNIDSLPGEM